MTDTRSKLGGSIKRYRRKRQETLDTLSEATGIDRSDLSKYENGRITPQGRTLQRIVDALDIPEIEFAALDRPGDFESLSIGIDEVKRLQNDLSSKFDEILAARDQLELKQLIDFDFRQANLTDRGQAHHEVHSLIAKGDSLAAIVVLTNMIESRATISASLKSSDFLDHCLRAALLKSKGKHTQALNDLETALRLDARPSGAAVQQALDLRRSCVNKLASQASNYKRAFSILHYPRDPDFEFDTCSFNILINKTETISEARQVYKELIESELRPDTYTLNTLISKSESFDQAKEFFDLFETYGEAADEITFCSIISRAPSDALASAYFSTYLANIGQADLGVYSAYMKKASGLGPAMDLFEDFKKRGGEPDPRLWSTLIAHASSFEEAFDLLGEFKGSGKEPTISILNTVLSKAERPDRQAKVHQEIEELALENDVTKNIILEKCKDIYDAGEYYAKWGCLGWKPNIFSMNTMIKKSISQESAEEYFNRIFEIGLKPNSFTATLIIMKCEDYGSAVGHYRRLQEAGISLNNYHISALINMSETFEQAETHYKELLSLGQTPSVVTLNSMIAKSNSISDAKKYFSEIKRTNQTPSVRSYERLTFISKNLGEALFYAKEMRSVGLEMNIRITKNIMMKTRDYKVNRALFDGVRTSMPGQVDEFFYCRMIRLSPNKEIAREHYLDLRRSGIPITEKTLYALSAQDLWLEEEEAARRIGLS